jgi:hypothetical protein
LFSINATFRNDYTSDDPPPAENIPVSPADGTAYIYLNAQVYNENGIVNATNVSFSDFIVAGLSGTGLVLGSGQTQTLNILMMSNQTNFTKFDLNLLLLSDSIPT